MVISIEFSIRTCAVIVFILYSGSNLAGDIFADDFRALVVVGDRRDEACVRQIGGAAVEVAAPFATAGVSTPLDYSDGNSHALSVRHFSVYVARANAGCKYESFWRDRLSRDNPLGRVAWVVHRAGAADNDVQAAVNQAIEVHRILTSALPEHRQAFNENLVKELARLRRLRFEPISLVSNHPQGKLRGMAVGPVANAQAGKTE